MGTAAAIRLTKPRISAMILEGTALAVSIILVAWLFFWFIIKQAQKDQIESFYVRLDGAAGEAPFQAADVRRFRGPSGSGEIHESRATDLKEEVLEKVRRGGGPLVIYISAPTLERADKASDPIRDLIGHVARESKRSAVLLALDLAQVDTDRDLGVYGLSPYSQIAEGAEELGGSATRVFVMTSAAPAQKSWSADGLGQSIFAYYLREGLEGKARGWDEKRPDSITIAGLHAYVLRHVRAWVQDHRRSVQTPMLLPESALAKDADTPVLRVAMSGRPRPPAGTGSAPAANAPAKAGAPAKVDAEGKPEIAVAKDADPGPPDILKDLIAEWKHHDHLRKDKPYRYLPGAWRSYQAALLRAERRVRVARLDPEATDVLGRAREDLKNAREKGLDLEKQLGQRIEADENLRFRSVIGDREGRGKRELDRALAYLTGRGSDGELSPPPEKERVAAVEPAKGADQPPAARKAAADVPPAGLLEITPDSYLELQLPAWAYQFGIRFGRPKYFRDDEARKEALRELVRIRADAERALERDRRGLGWIQPVVEGGDAVRREIQDELLSGTRYDPRRSPWTDRLDQVRDKYAKASQRSEDYAKARETWEEAAADLPSLVEWAVRRESFKSSPVRSPADAIPDAAGRAWDAFDRLARQLRIRPIAGEGEKSEEWFRDLRKATDDARKGLEALRGQFDDAIGTLNPRDWTAVDAALRTPLIPHGTREALLAKLPLEEQPVTLRPGAGNGLGGRADYPPDPGFWARAAGLAQLDLTLGRMARDLGLSEDDAPGFKDLAVAWQRAKSLAGGGTGDSSQFPDFTAAVRKAAPDPGGLDPPSQPGRSKRREELEQVLNEQDRRARLLDAWPFHSTRATEIDDAADRYRAFGRFAALAFHLDRLRKDDADSRTLGDLIGAVKEAANAVPVPIEPGSLDANNASLRPAFRSDQIRLKQWEGTVDVVLRRSGEGGDSIPAGQGFIGLLIPDGLELVNAPPGAAIPGRLVKVGGPRPAAADEVVGSYPLVQADFAANRPFDVKAIAFYRGRVDEESVATAIVSPGPENNPVSIRIGADKEAWKRSYEGENIGQIEDQFEKHPHQGYMHLGGSLGYLVTVRNQFPRDLKVKCTVELTGRANGQANPGEKLFDDILPLARRGDGTDNWTFPGKVSLDEDKPDETRVLRVSLEVVNPEAPVADPKHGAWKTEYKVTFSQVDVAKYMDISDEFKSPCSSREHPPNQHCYVVWYKRRKNDPFTEPIRADQWTCQIVEKRAKGDPKMWIWPGDEGLGFHYYPADQAAGTYSWSGEIENEQVEGKVGQWSRRTKKP